MIMPPWPTETVLRHPQIRCFKRRSSSGLGSCRSCLLSARTGLLLRSPSSYMFHSLRKHSHISKLHCGSTLQTPGTCFCSLKFYVGRYSRSCVCLCLNAQQGDLTASLSACRRALQHTREDGLREKVQKLKDTLEAEAPV